MHDERFNLSVIKKILPHREPFLFVEKVVAFEKNKSIVAQKRLSAREDYFRGHFPGRPVMPGVLVVEALAQASGLLLGLTNLAEQTPSSQNGPGLYLARTDIKFLSPAEPRQTLHLQSKFKKAFGRLYLFEVAALVENRLIAAGSLALGKSA